jgi:hypothetical protein
MIVRMKRSLRLRLEKLEAEIVASTGPTRRVGVLWKLPDDYEGERHVAIVTRHSSPSSLLEGYIFEERPGPAPPGYDDGVRNVYLTADEMMF